MNKKEQQQLEDLKQELRFARALRFTEEVEFDVPAPANCSGGFIKGYAAWPHGDRPRVEVGCSSSVSHAFGRTDRTDSQGPRSLYSTKLLALRALRNGVEKECATKLARIDKMIEDEMSATIAAKVSK